MYFDGRGDATSFVEKAELIAALKGHTEASKLVPSAFDVYRRLFSDDKKNPDKIKGDLLKGFCREERNNDEALDALMNCLRSPAESPQSILKLYFADMTSSLLLPLIHQTSDTMLSLV